MMENLGPWLLNFLGITAATRKAYSLQGVLYNSVLFLFFNTNLQKNGKSLLLTIYCALE